MPDAFAAFGGVDFSGAREPLANLWTALGKEVSGRLRITDLRPHAYRADLAAFVAGGWRTDAQASDAILWGAGFPFGLPAEVATALGAGASWSSYLPWVADRPPDEVRGAAGNTARSLRLTDTSGALSPLDLRLYKQTVEGLRWLNDMREGESEVCIHPQCVVDGAATTIIEVYPSVTVRDLGLPRRRVPGRPGEIKARIAALKPFLEFQAPVFAATACALEDAWDACIACLSAFLCRHDLDQPRRINAGPWERIAAEGWIYRPPAALG
jgi:hypothetical protein